MSVKVEKIASARAEKSTAVKAFIACISVALAILLPQIIHISLGAQGGARWLPMYLPVLLGACLLGRSWGVGIALVSPLVSFIITSIAGNAMPAAGRLPYMMAELAVFALVSGTLSKKIKGDIPAAFIAVLSAQIAGRAAYLLLIAIFNFSALSSALAQVKSGIVGLALQAVTVPLIIIGANYLAKKEDARR